MTYSILEYPGCLESNCHGWREIFALAERTAGGKEVLVEAPERGADIVLVPGCMGADSASACVPRVLGALRRAKERGAVAAAACSGVAALLAAGLDGGRRVTCHWSLEDGLRAAFPRARVDARELVIDSGDMISAGGVLAWIDLGLHVVGRFLSPQIARRCARVLVWDPGRARQSPYSDPIAAAAPLRPDPALARAEEWIRGKLGSAVGIERWARESGMGGRSLERRWKAAYGKPPAAWLRSARIALAKSLLESGDSGWESITAACGYSDPSRFRSAFQSETGWSPRRYRQAFRLHA